MEGYTVQTGQMGSHCVDLNTENPTVTEYLKDCYTKFIIGEVYDFPEL